MIAEPSPSSRSGPGRALTMSGAKQSTTSMAAGSRAAIWQPPLQRSPGAREAPPAAALASAPAPQLQDPREVMRSQRRFLSALNLDPVSQVLRVDTVQHQGAYHLCQYQPDAPRHAPRGPLDIDPPCKDGTVQRPAGDCVDAHPGLQHRSSTDSDRPANDDREASMQPEALECTAERGL